MVVTGMWRQDESRIKIKANEYKWCLLHLEEGINHTWTNVFSLLLSLLSLSLSLSLLSYSCSLHLINLATKCPPVLIICLERSGRVAVVFTVCRWQNCHRGEIHKRSLSVGCLCVMLPVCLFPLDVCCSSAGCFSTGANVWWLPLGL